MVTDGGYLFTHFRFDFEQVNFEALLYLTCLLLGCCFFGTEAGDLLRTHTKKPWSLKCVDVVILPHPGPRALLQRNPAGFHSLAPTWDARLCLLHRHWQRVKRQSVHISSCCLLPDLSQTVPELVTKQVTP